MITPGQKTYKDIGFDNFGTRIAVRPVQVNANQMDAFYELAKKQIMEENLRDAIVSAAKIAASAVSESKIAAGAVSADKIAADAVSADKIAADAVTATKISADAVTADKIDVSQLSAIAADLGTITAGLVTGATIQTAASGARIVLTSGDRLYIKNGDTTIAAIYYGGSYFELEASASYDTAISGGGTRYYFGTNNLMPATDNAKDCGGASNAWRMVYSYGYTDLCLLLDELDDIEILKKCEPIKDENGNIVRDENGMIKMDNSSLPEWMQEGKNEEGQTFRNLGKFVDLIAGAVRQLAGRVEKLEEAIKS
jgi:hypothetical protein